MSIVSPNKVENIPLRPKMGGKSISFGDNAQVSGNVVVADSIKNSFNAAAQSNAPDELKTLLKELTTRVGEMTKAMPAEAAKETGENLEALVNESIKEKPRQKWYQLSGEGLIEAAKAVGDIGKPVVETVMKILALLG